MDGRNILIAANPKSGSVSRKSLLDQLKDGLTNDGFVVTVCESLDEVHCLARQLHAQSDLHTVIAAGGDGTAAAVANRIAADIPMLVYPLGTENLLGKHLGLGTEISSARDRIRRHESIAMDVGLANGKMFLVMASCGFDALVVQQMHAIRKGHINRFSYAVPIWRALKRYRFPMLNSRSLAPSQNVQQELLHTSAWLFVFNVPRYAARLKFCPQADPLDGQLDVCTFRRPGIFHGISYLTSLWIERHQRLNDYAHWRTQTITIDTPVGDSPRTNSTATQDVPYQLDGDPGGVLPLRIAVQPGRLRLII
jgi:diacylglycerol kinase family enzyme